MIGPNPIWEIALIVVGVTLVIWRNWFNRKH
jgi:hypothetical protein